MAEKEFRKNLDLLIDQNLNELLKEVKEHNHAISNAKDKSKAQIWVALAILNNKINNLNIGNKDYKKKIPKNEMDKILKTLETL